MTIGGYAIGAKLGVHLPARRVHLHAAGLEAALAARRKARLLGKNMLGSGFDFDIEIRMGAGAYVCGEETALIESLEGIARRAAQPAALPGEHRAGGRADRGQQRRDAHRLRSHPGQGAGVVQEARHRRLDRVEAAVGFRRLREAGRVRGRLGARAVAELLKLVERRRTPRRCRSAARRAGRCRATQFGRKLGFEDLATGGSIIVIGPNRDMLDVAENFLDFFVEESCGQCTPCREGNPKLLEGVHLLKQGRCRSSYLRELQNLGRTMQAASKCGLGQSSANAFLDITEHFRSEILGRVPAKGETDGCEESNPCAARDLSRTPGPARNR